MDGLNPLLIRYGVQSSHDYALVRFGLLRMNILVHDDGIETICGRKR
jgi:hypothetical protein